MGAAMCCKQNNRITFLKGLITDVKNLPYSYEPAILLFFKNYTVAGSMKKPVKF